MHKPQPRKRCIIIGDLNSIVNVDLDKKGGNKTIITQNSVLRYLIDNDFTDTFRYCNPNQQDFTWHNKRSSPEAIATRIDYIWV